MEYTISATIKAPVSKIYEGWLNSKIHSEMTGGKAEISDELNKVFTSWDDYISGVNIELVKDSFIRQAWRTIEFEVEQADSLVEIYFEEVDPNKTKITLHHKNLLHHDLKYKLGWVEHYFEPMKEYFEKQV
jgi:activator of HSP90 ATPase